MAFRDAYVQVGNNLDQLSTPDHDATVRARDHIGSTGNLGLTQLGETISAQRQRWQQQLSGLEAAWEHLLSADVKQLTTP